MDSFQRSAHRRCLWIALLLATAATLLLVACGETTGTSPSPTTVATLQPSPTTASSPTSTKVVQVKIVEKNGAYSFEPATLTLPKGAQVVWTNSSDAPHTVTSDTNAFGTTSNLTENKTFMAVFNTAGTYTYHCSIHSYMKGTITVAS